MRRARTCEICGHAYRPGHATSRFCSRRCTGLSKSLPTGRTTQYAYHGRLSDELWRQILAARAEAPTTDLYRPGASI